MKISYRRGLRGQRHSPLFSAVATNPGLTIQRVSLAVPDPTNADCGRRFAETDRPRLPSTSRLTVDFALSLLFPIRSLILKPITGRMSWGRVWSMNANRRGSQDHLTAGDLWVPR
jgi:hypothetical protein